MNKTAIIIPSRLNAQRLPNKPLKLINNKEMILHVYDAAIKSKTRRSLRSHTRQKIIDIIKNFWRQSNSNLKQSSNRHRSNI